MASTRREFMKALVGSTLAAWAGGLAPQLGQRFYHWDAVSDSTTSAACASQPDLTLDNIDAAIERLRIGPQSLVIEHIAMVERIEGDGSFFWRRLDTGKVVG